MHVTVADLKYELKQAREAITDNDGNTTLNDKIKHLKIENEGLHNALSAERMKNEKFTKFGIECSIKPDKKLEESKNDDR